MGNGFWEFLVVVLLGIGVASPETVTNYQLLILQHEEASVKYNAFRCRSDSLGTEYVLKYQMQSPHQAEGNQTTLTCRISETAVSVQPDLMHESFVITTDGGIAGELHGRGLTCTYAEKKTEGIFVDRSASSYICKDEKQGFVVQLPISKWKRSAVNNPTCVRRSIIKDIDDRSLGTACGPENGDMKWMYNREGKLTCTQCCSGYYWEKSDRKCQKCGDANANPYPNVRAGCHIPQTKDTTTSTLTSTTSSGNPKPTAATARKGRKGPKERPSETRTTEETLTTPGVTTEARLPPTNVRLKHPTQAYSAEIEFDPISAEGNAVKTYAIMIRVLSSPEIRSYDTKTTSFMVDSLLPDTSYETWVVARYKTGAGPRSNSLVFSTTKKPPQALRGVKVTIRHGVVSATWSWHGKQPSDEEPILGYKAAYTVFRVNKTAIPTMVVVNGSDVTEMKFDVKVNTGYVVKVCSYSLAGDGQYSRGFYVYGEFVPRDDWSEIGEHFFPTPLVIFIVVILFCLLLAIYCYCLQSRTE